MGIEKAFDLLGHTWLISNLEKYAFGKNLILWVKILLRDKGSRILSKEVQLPNIFHLRKVHVKVTQFQLYYLF